MLDVCLPMYSTVDTIARRDKGDITINSQGQGFTSYSPHPTVFKGLCPTTVGRTADGTRWSTGGTLNMGKRGYLAKSWSLPLPVMSPPPPRTTGLTVEHMGRHAASIRVPPVIDDCRRQCACPPALEHQSHHEHGFKG